MKRFETTKIIKDILTRYPYTRDDDYLLWLYVLRHLERIGAVRRFTKVLTVELFLAGANYCSFPHFETVSRVRRKLQEKYPELRGTARTRKARAELENEFVDFARRELTV